VGQGTETTLIMGAIHGDEPAAGALVNELGNRLRSDPGLLERRRVVLLPAANPDGLAARTRENARGIDLNRNFDAANRVNNGTNGLTPLTEPESQALQSVIKEYAPSRIVSVHQPLSCIDYDGPGEAIAARMAQECDLPVKKIGARPGSLGSYTGESLKIPTITMELPPEASKLSDEALWQKYGRALISAILYPEHAK
jgi:protein MpaA